MGLSRLVMMLSFKTLLLSYFLATNSIIILIADKDTATTKLHLTTTTTANPPSPPPPPPPPQDRSKMAPFKPTIAVVVGVLTTLFSITFLLLLYAKHCRRENGHEHGYGYNNFRGRGGGPAFADRKNSGVDRTVVESLPIFRFGSLRGGKDGLECAVCLNRFEQTEILKLLPKCKHAFHVECVDTWLDAHATCPLCRNRVDPEDILLLNDAAVKVVGQNEEALPPATPPESLRRVSGRHSSAGERGSRNGGGFLQIVVEKPEVKSNGGEKLTTRRSLDGWNLKKINLGQTTPKKKTKEALGVGCFDRRKDGMLLTLEEEERTSFDRRRLEHRIIVGGGSGGGEVGLGVGFQQRWSDVQPSDLLYLRSEMIMSDSRGLWASGSRPSDINRGRDVINGNGRSVSEITGLSRLSSNYGGGNNHQHHRGRRRGGGGGGGGEREAGVVSRWLAWVSQSSHSSHVSSQTQTQQTLPAEGS